MQYKYTNTHRKLVSLRRCVKAVQMLHNKNPCVEDEQKIGFECKQTHTHLKHGKTVGKKKLQPGLEPFPIKVLLLFLFRFLFIPTRFIRLYSLHCECVCECVVVVVV